MAMLSLIVHGEVYPPALCCNEVPYRSRSWLGGISTGSKRGGSASLYPRDDGVSRLGFEYLADAAENLGARQRLFGCVHDIPSLSPNCAQSATSTERPQRARA